MKSDFELLLFSTQTTFIQEAVQAGVHGIIVDWEHIGKEDRQVGADTQINHDTLEDLNRVRACTHAQIICRINSFGATTSQEIEQAIGAGVDEILLPMVRSIREVEAVLNQVKERCGVGILVETVRATRLVKELARLPLCRVYVGLNDLAIDRACPNIFQAVIDGTVENIRQAFTVPFGFAGLTLPDRGFPIPCRLLIGEMVRLKCNFSFLRRSFHGDIQGRDLAVEVPRLLASLHQARLRSPAAVAQDHRHLETAVRGWPEKVIFSERVSA